MIVLRAKDVDFEVTYINLREKPDWFLEISPHGKVPVLVVDEQPLFESNAIAEFLDEMVAPRLHPEDPIERAKNRAWTDFTATFAGALSKIHYAKTREDMEAAVEAAPEVLLKVEKALAGRGNNGPFFNGPDLSLVDAAYAPFLQRYLLIDNGLKNDVLKDFPLIRAWAETLMADERVTGAVPDNFEAEFIGNLHRRDLYAREFFENTVAAE